MTATPTRALRVLAANEDKRALDELAVDLRRLGHEVLDYAVDTREVVEAVAREDPDVSIVKVHADRGHALDLIGQLSSWASGPVVALIEREDPGFVARAADEGIHAYTAGGGPAAVQGALEVAIRRHAEVAALSEKVEQLESALERRAVIERAKGILMERHALDDQEAFELLRREARSGNRQVVSVAEAVADVRDAPDRRDGRPAG